MTCVVLNLHFSFLQVVIGRRPTRKPYETEPACQKQDEKIKEGDMCLVNVPKYGGEWPQVAKVVEVTKGMDSVLIQWYKGSKTGPWSPCTTPAPGERGRRIPWTESVLLEHVWHYGFSFTPSRHLPSSVRSKIDSFTDF